MYSLLVVVFLSSCRQVSRFILMLSSWRRRLLCLSSFSFYRNVSFVASFVSSCRRVLRFVDDGIKSAVTRLFPPFPAHVIKTNGG